MRASQVFQIGTDEDFALVDVEADVAAGGDMAGLPNALDELAPVAALAGASLPGEEPVGLGTVHFPKVAAEQLHLPCRLVGPGHVRNVHFIRHLAQTSKGAE